MFKWPIMAATVALAIGLQPAAGRAQEIETIFAIPSQTLTFATTTSPMTRASSRSKV